MLIRALIVLLIVLNLGVAGWWISRPAAPLPAPPAQPRNVAKLWLASEAPPAPRAAAATSATNATPTAATSTVTPPPVATAQATQTVVSAPLLQCFSLGPFADANAAKAATIALQSDATRSRTREVEGRSVPGNYTVFLPPEADRAAAQALAQRIAAAGFDDFMIINEGPLTNGIALGLYRSRSGAERRQSALQSAGFPAQMQTPDGAALSQWWADVATALGAAQARAKAGAKQSQALDCAALR